MPKEVTHWTIASKALARLHDCPLKVSLSTHFPLFLLGAVLPDSPFYVRRGKDKDFYLKTAEKIHGEHGEDTYNLFKKEFLRKGQAISPAEMALSCGFLSHIQTDAHFHPLVYYFCGHESGSDTTAHKKALTRHFQFETLMDIHNWRGVPFGYGNRLSKIVRSSVRDTREISLMIAEFYLGSVDEYRRSLKMLKRHMRLQSLFRFSFLRILLCLLPGMASMRALFYPVIKRKMPFFHLPIRYRHPRTGEWHEESYDELESRCVDKQVQLFTEIDDHMSRGDIFPLFADQLGPSLATGQPHSYNKDMKYFDTSLSIKRLLYKFPGSPSIF